MSPGQESVDRWLAEHYPPAGMNREALIELTRRGARANLLAELRAQVEELEHAPGCQGELQPALCWCPIHRVLALLSR